MAKKGLRIVCRSVFRDGKSTTKALFTQKWIEMINRLEKRKENSARKA